MVQETSQLEKPEVVQSYDVNQTHGRTIFTRLSSLAAFGFTIGASNSLVKCISEINRLKDVCWNSPIGLDRAASDLLTKLHDSEGLGIVKNWQALSTHDQIVQCHLRAFRSAAIIHFYRVLFDSPPCSVQRHVYDVFRTIQIFYRLGGGNLSLWPAFIAAVEAYEDAEVEMAKSWLATSIHTGIGNRYQAKVVVEQVWQKREEISREASQDKGSIPVDWRDIMHNLDLDVPLI